MEKYKIDLSNYEISICEDGNILFVTFGIPTLPWQRGSSPDGPGFEYEFDKNTGEMIKVTGIR
jgi:hypothetical protein